MHTFIPRCMQHRSMEKIGAFLERRREGASRFLPRPGLGLGLGCVALRVVRPPTTAVPQRKNFVLLDENTLFADRTSIVAK